MGAKGGSMMHKWGNEGKESLPLIALPTLHVNPKLHNTQHLEYTQMQYKCTCMSHRSRCTPL